jgi:hypothetical protein
MSSVIPFQLQRQVSLEDEARKNIFSLPPARLEKFWEAINTAVHGGYPVLTKMTRAVLDVSFEREHISSYGITIIEGMVLLIRRIKSKLAILGALDITTYDFWSHAKDHIFFMDKSQRDDETITIVGGITANKSANIEVLIQKGEHFSFEGCSLPLPLPVTI